MTGVPGPEPGGDLICPVGFVVARIVEADDSFGKALGVRLGGGFPSARIGPTLGSLTSQDATLLQAPFVNLPANPNSGLAATMAVSLFSPAASRFLNLEVSALEADGKGRIVSSPRVVTADQVKALIEQGTEFPYQTATSSGATAIAFRKANLKLEVTPQITPDNRVLMEVKVTKDAPDFSVASSTGGIPAISKNEVNAKVLVADGETIVIGGVYSNTQSKSVDKVPFLGDLPFIGRVFKRDLVQDRKAELLVFLTPRIMNNQAIAVNR